MPEASETAVELTKAPMLPPSLVFFLLNMSFVHLVQPAAQHSTHAVFRRVGQRDRLDEMLTRILSKLGHEVALMIVPS
jgi:hypothetical protein